MEQSKTLKEYLEEEISSMQKRIDEVDKACKEYRTQCAKYPKTNARNLIK